MFDSADVRDLFWNVHLSHDVLCLPAARGVGWQPVPAGACPMHLVHNLPLLHCEYTVLVETAAQWFVSDSFPKLRSQQNCHLVTAKTVTR